MSLIVGISITCSIANNILLCPTHICLWILIKRTLLFWISYSKSEETWIFMLMHYNWLLVNLRCLVLHARNIPLLLQPQLKSSRCVYLWSQSLFKSVISTCKAKKLQERKIFFIHFTPYAHKHHALARFIVWSGVWKNRSYHLTFLNCICNCSLCYLFL